MVCLNRSEPIFSTKYLTSSLQDAYVTKVTLFSKRFIAIIFLFFLVFSHFAVAQEGFTPSALTLTIFADGDVRAEYILDVDVTLPRISVPLLGVIYENLYIVDENNNPLDHSPIQGGINVDTLGSGTVNITYDTFDLTNKTGRLWTLTANIPVDTLVALPETATIISVNQLPKAISTIGERTAIVLPAGNLTMSYSIGVQGTKENALALISKAEAEISETTAQRINVTEASQLVQEARKALDQQNFSGAEELASNALSLIPQIMQTAQQAKIAIDKTKSDIIQTLQESRTLNLDNAQQLLTEAETKYSLGKYNESKVFAEQGDQAINLAKTENTTFPFFNIIIVGVVIAVSAVLILFFLKTRKRKSPQSSVEIPSQKRWRNIDLAKILAEKPQLRFEDQEVVKFIAESGGEVFESEVREKFQLPKTTVWRMGKRLVDEGIVEIVNLRGNNLIRILTKYEV